MSDRKAAAVNSASPGPEAEHGHHEGPDEHVGRLIHRNLVPLHPCLVHEVLHVLQSDSKVNGEGDVKIRCFSQLLKGAVGTIPIVVKRNEPGAV